MNKLFSDLTKLYFKAPIEFNHLKPITLAQWILESGRGDSPLANDHLNFGGMKWREEMRPYATKVRYLAHDGEDDYCKFESLEKFIEGYWAFIERSPYIGWRDNSDSGRSYIRFIGPIYAGDSQYGENVLNLLDEAEKLLLQVEHEGHHLGTSEPVQKPKIKEFIQSPYFSSRSGAEINTIVLHYTTAGNVQSTIGWFKQNPHEVSAHYIIDKNGDIYQMVADTHKAHHAAAANRTSIGIEHVAKNGDRLTRAQEASSIDLIRWLMTEYKIPAANVLAHKEAPGNSTRCPGELFGDNGDDNSSARLKMFDAWVAKHFERSMTPIDGTDTVDEDTRSVYIVKPGDTFSRIATIHGMSVDELKVLNPDVANINQIFPGQAIHVSAASGEGIGGNGIVNFAFKIAEKYISAAAGTHQPFSNPVLGTGKITGGFMEEPGHSKKGTLKAVFLDASLKTFTSSPSSQNKRNIGIDYVINDYQVKAWYSGKVSQRGLEKGYGNRVHILLDIEFKFQGASYAVYQAFAHLRSMSVSVGDTINQGQVIGVMGGSSTKSQGERLILVQDAYPIHVDLDTYIRKDGDRVSINPQLIDKQLGWTF